MQLIVTPTYDGLGRAAAEVVAAALAAKPDLVLGLPTGATPVGLYAELVRRRLDFSRATSFNLDDYVGVPPEHPQSFRLFMRRHLFEALPFGASHYPDAADCAAYDAAIAAAGGIDLLVLGIGVNGHLGFNEPGSPFESRSRVLALEPSTIAIHGRLFADRPAPTTGVTMGIATMLEARRILLLASGAGKAEILARALLGPVVEAIPASSLRNHPDVTVIADADAAALLEQPSCR